MNGPGHDAGNLTATALVDDCDLTVAGHLAQDAKPHLPLARLSASSLQHVLDHQPHRMPLEHAQQALPARHDRARYDVTASRTREG